MKPPSYLRLFTCIILAVCSYSVSSSFLGDVDLPDISSLFLNGTGCLRVPSIPNIGHCGVPYELSNFQGLFKCSSETKIGRPKNVADVAALVKEFPRVKGVGTGLSWNKEQFCAGPDKSSISIAMTEMGNLRQLFTKPPKDWDYDSPDFPMQLDEKKGTVTVAAGVPLRTLLNFLAYPGLLKGKCALQPTPLLPQCGKGHFLKMVPQILEVTMGGGVATSTHGSAAESTTLSSQVVGVEVVLADGSVKTFTAEQHPRIMRALRASVGQLGIITKLVFQVIPQPMIRRTRDEISESEAVERMKKISAAYKKAASGGKKVDLRAVLKSLGIKDALILWFMTSPGVWWIETEPTSDEHVIPKAMVQEAIVQGSLIALHVGKEPVPVPPSSDQVDVAEVPQSPILACAGNNVLFCPQVVAGGFKTIVDKGLNDEFAPALFAYPTTRPEWFTLWANIGRTAEYEVCVPIEEAGDAMEEILKYITTSKQPRLRDAFRTPTGFRIVAEDDAFLAAGNGGARVCMEIDDFVYLNVGSGDTPNKPVEDIVAIMMKYKGRLHWGKHGWNSYEPCFDGYERWGKSWCEFGCVKMELDPPPHKFKSESDTWKWFAQRSGKSVDNFGDCCTKDGFSEKCTCAPRPKSTCPAASKVEEKSSVDHSEL